MDVTITNAGGRIEIVDLRNDLTNNYNVLKDGLRLFNLGNIVRITFINQTNIEINYDEVELINGSSSIFPISGSDFLNQLDIILGDYGGGTGGGDMYKSVYDTDNDGVVDKAETVQIIVRNSTGSTLTKGQIVYLSGATGNRPNALLAQANAEATSSKTIGWVFADISNNSDGYVCVSGSQHDLDTSAFSAGDALWLSPTVAGGITSTIPVQPNHAVFIGYCARSHPTQGRIVFKIQNGYELQELHNILITSVANNDGLFYESSTSLWKNKTITTVLGFTPVTNARTLSGIKSVSGGGDFTANRTFEFVNDQTSPAYPGVYGIDSSGIRNWRSDTSVRGNIPLLNMQESYPVGTNQTGILYVASVSKLYVCNLSGSTVNIFDTTTGVLLSTIAVTNAYKPFYIASINEVWVTSTSLLTINRISATLNSSLGTIIGATIFGTEAIEYSLTKVFICCGNATGSIMVINPSTLLVTATITTNVPASPQGMALNTNVASSQYDKIIVSASAGVAILNPTTNTITTTVVNPSSSISTGTKIRYITSTNQYVLSSFGNNSIVVLDIASATTFTLNSTIRNLPGILDVGLDETNNYLFAVFTGLVSALNLFVSIIDLPSKKVKNTIPTNVLCGSSATSGYIAMDTTNNRFFICGRSTNTNAATAIKYL